MKFLVLIVASCMLASGINGQETVAATPTLEELITKASDLFNKLSMLQSEVASDIQYDYIYTKYETLNEKLERLACKQTSDLLVAKADTLSQLDQSKEYLKSTSSATAIKICSVTAKIDIDLYIQPEITYNIQSALMYFKSTLSQIQTLSYSLFYNYDMYTKYSEVLYGENVNIDDVQNYIYSLESQLSTYRYDAKSKAQSFIYRLDSLVSQFDTRGQEKSMTYQTILSNVNTNFYNCVSSNYAL